MMTDNPLLLYVGVMVAGLVAAVAVGSMAFFNSKRPAGWEGAGRPQYVPQYGQDSETPPEWEIGWTEKAERWNGRLAMLGFVISIAVEATVGHSVLAAAFGLR
ncbi:MAG: chlorophyll a/b-binding protein [Cyanobacteriota bacterium]